MYICIYIYIYIYMCIDRQICIDITWTYPSPVMERRSLLK